MNLMHKKTIFLAVLVVSSLIYNQNTIASSTPGLSATIQIISPQGWHMAPINTDWTQNYIAKITATNTGSTKISGWQMVFNLPSNQQSIQTLNGSPLIWEAIAVTTNNPISIINNTNFTNIEPGQSRSIYMIVNSPDGIPTPTKYQTALNLQ